MKKIKKILLNSTGIFGQSNEDMFINIEVDRAVKELKPDRFDNNFDLQRQFDNERNGSRNFFIYGTIDPVVELGDGFELELYKESVGPTNSSLEDQLVIVDQVDQTSITLSNGAQLTFVKNIETRDLTYQTGNVFGAKQKEYGELLDGYSSSDEEVIYLFVKGNIDTLTPDSSEPAIPDQLFKQRLVFFDGSGDFLEYGNDTQEIRDDGSTFSVNNDFPFFYDIHWIKNSLSINQVTKLTVNFDQVRYFALEGNVVNLTLSLDRPSVNGNEIIRLQVRNITTSNDDYTLDTEFITWLPGEKDKTIPLQISSDDEVETIEFLEISLADPINLLLGERDTANVDILTDGVTNSVVYDFQSMYKNLLSFGKILVSENNVIDDEFKSARLRNGYIYDQQDSESFYPSENFSLEIKNLGNFTVLPEIPGINNEERVFRPGESFTFDLLNNFESATNLHEIRIRINIDQVNPNASFVFINGFIFQNIRTPEELETAIDAINDSVKFEYFVEEVISDINGDPVEFDSTGTPLVEIALDEDGNQVILDKYLTAKSLDTFTPMVVRNLQENNTTDQFSTEEVVSFENPQQTPFQVELLSNRDNGGTCFYEFVLTQKNLSNSDIPTVAEYKEIVIPATFLTAKDDPDTVYLTSEYREINRPYSGIDCIDPSIINDPSFEQIGNASVNGVLFLATQNNVTESLNHEFKSSRVSVENCTINGSTNNFLGGFKI